MDQRIRPIPGAPSGPLAADFERLCEAVAEAGRLALSYYGKSPERRLKSDGTEVSEADLAVDDLLKSALLGARPGYGWRSEESGHDPALQTSPFRWVVDPIDGTRAFLKNIPDWTVSVALLEDVRPVLAAVFNPVRGEFYHAVRGAGAFLNGAPIQVSDARDLEGIRLAASARMLKRDIWRQPWLAREDVWAKSIAYRLALTASGAFDAAIFAMGSDWDVAAAHLLLEEAGGRLTNWRGAALVYDGSIPRHEAMIAAGPALHEKLLARAA